MHGQYIKSSDNSFGRRQLLWLLRADLKAETESLTTAATHDQALQTKYYATKIKKTERDSKNRLCQKIDEAVEHIISVCPILAKEQYIQRHDRVCAQLYFNMCKEIRIKLDNEHWYDRVATSAETSRVGTVVILWNQQVHTDRTIPNHKPHNLW